MTIKEFIEVAIEGGWNYKNTTNPRAHNFGLWVESGRGIDDNIIYSQVLLDPEAWKAVGKVKGWEGGDCPTCGYVFDQEEPLYHMSQMIYTLCKGKTLEEYIATL